MLLVLFLFMLCCAVKCDYVSNNYYIIEMPEPEVARDYNTPFKVYWNVPTKQCRSRNVIFDNLEKFGIIQNQDDNFEGERITIMYDPGVFPAIFKADSGKYRYRNGGVPQQGNLELHLTAFRESLNKSIPNPDFSGIGVIDFESWRPIFRQQFGSLKPYIDLSMNIEKRRHWWWPASWQKMEATKRFEDAARLFMQTTLSIAKQMRPRAMWGYYAYPYCYNMAGTRMAESCSSDVKRENDKIYWQWAESTALYPSVYSSVNLSTSQLAALVRGRVTEANRVKKAGTLVLPYFWFRYRDAGFMTEEDVTAVFDALMKTNASGLIIWGSSNDVNELNKCNELYKYVETKLGPIIKKYIQQINRNYDSTLHDDAENGDEYNDAFINTTAATITVKPTTVEPTSVELTSVQQTIDQLTTNQPTTDQQTTDQPTTVQTTLNEIDSTTSHSYKIGFNLNFTLLPKNIYDKIASDIKEIQLNDSYNKTDDDKIDPETLEESSFWDMLKKQLYFDTENNKQSTRSIQNEENPDDLENNNAGSYFKRAAILDVTSTQKNIDNLFSQTVMPEDHLTRILGANSDKFLASLEKHTNPVSLTSADGTANDNLDPFLVNLTPPVIESGNTNYYKSVEDTFPQSTTEKLENFVIIRGNENEDSAMSEISKSVIETFPETSTDISENFVIISDKENKDTGSWFSSERLNSEQYERNVNET